MSARASGRAVLIAAFATAFLFAGCFGYTDGCVPPIRAQDAPMGAPIQDGPGGQSIRISVLDPDGRPVPEAAVVVHWNRDHIDEQEAEELDAPPVIGYMFLRTGSDGVAIAELPRDRYYIVSASAHDFTEEWTERFEPGEGNNMAHRITLWPKFVTFTHEATLPGPAAVPGLLGSNAGYHAVDVLWSEDPDVHQAATERFVSADIELTWSTDVTEMADLAVAWGNQDGWVEAGDDAQTGAGDHRETVTAGHAELESSMGERPHHLTLGAATWNGYVALGGVDYVVSATAELSTRTVYKEACGVMFGGSPLVNYHDDPNSFPSSQGSGIAAGNPMIGVALLFGVLIAAAVIVVVIVGRKQQS